MEDKQELSEQQKKSLSLSDHLQHIDRAEILAFNNCFGNKRELASQFKDVQKLSKRVEKPVLHLSLRLAPDEILTKNQLIEIGQACAKEFGIEDHQYICVLHKDTKEQHIHIAANRVGFDGKVASDSNNYKLMANLCRRLEKQYQLKEVLNPRAFLSPKDRMLPRYDQRKEKLKADIKLTLSKVSQYSLFEKEMKVKGYIVIKGRGISFIDSKKVKIKGSEVGYSLSKIENTLLMNQKLKQLEPKQSDTSFINHTLSEKNNLMNHKSILLGGFTENSSSNLLHQLLKNEPEVAETNPQLLKETKRRRKGLKINR
ncbi:relaxase/mobilization nuclease domain-containing protein [Solitalea lacus]|uniref:relaxase/mobilization nuclease domain-containing protein n=1 Tax=Solitalea lacus TaxID=2911172 RepID=UPI001EDC3A48|nr:relaxase/mobilization nuclease domain-containing protein [Solitalea lacus]